MNPIFRPLRSAGLLTTLGFVLLCSAIRPVSAQAIASVGQGAPDVLVVGGTPAGVAAAIAVARPGERVTLVSATDDLGGVLTGAMMDQWDLNTAPDGTPIERGIFSEIYDRLGDAFAPGAAAATLERLVAAEPNVTVRLDEAPVAAQTIVIGAIRAIGAVSFRNVETGVPTRITAPYVIDATDFGDVAALAGARYDLGRQDSGIDDRTQAVTLMFVVDGIDWRALTSSYDEGLLGAGGVTARRAWGYAKSVAAYRPRSPDVLVRDLNLGLLPDGSVSVNAIDIVGIDGLRASDRERARRLTETEAPRLIAYLRSRLPGFADARVAGFAPEVYVRETRHVAGLERLTTSDVWLGKIPGDTIGLSSYPIDLHPVDATEGQSFAPIRHIYGIPFGALVPRGFANLLVASPAISASHLASGSARVIPTTIEEGEAAGAAAGLADRAGLDFPTFATSTSEIARLRRDLDAQGAIVSLERVPSAKPADGSVVAHRTGIASRPV